MNEKGSSFHHPAAFWLGSAFITAGVLAHIPMFVCAAEMNYRMVGMPMDATMLTGMALIPLGLMLAWYGLMPRLALLRQGHHDSIHFHAVDYMPLTRRHWTLIIALFIAATVRLFRWLERKGL